MLGAQQLLMMLVGRWGRSLAGWAIASMIIWYLFPLFPPLRPVIPRLSPSSWCCWWWWQSMPR
jgi:hypothetical protein